jgi:hypothetical protein
VCDDGSMMLNEPIAVVRLSVNTSISIISILSLPPSHRASQLTWLGCMKPDMMMPTLGASFWHFC